VPSNGHAGFGGRSGETHQRKRRQGAPGRPNLAEGKTHKEALRATASERWRYVNGPHLVALVRAGAKFEKGALGERPDQAGMKDAA
jgi:hypothetical protein